MYLHLGNETLVRTKDLIGIFDLENTSVSKATKGFLAQADKLGRVVNVSMEMPKSFVVTLDEELTERVYVTNIACRTLFLRSKRQAVQSAGI
ncbi:MAG: DUF370 domain-containing protein [Oscillospiraceae bacterium]